MFGDIPEDVTVDYTLQCNCNASNPRVFEGDKLTLNTYASTNKSTSYWKFTLSEESDIQIFLNAPTNKNFTAIIYNESGVYDYECGTETSIVKTHLNAGTYYVEYKVKSIGEDSAQIGIFK